MMALVVLLFCVFKLVQGAVISKEFGFQLTIIHINDFHVRFEETDKFSLTCTADNDNCIGGFSRTYAAIKTLVEENPDSIVLNAGDSFQGTLWYTIYKWKAVQHFLNKIPFDAHTLGNHEFDDKIAGVIPFLQHLKAPVVVANIDDSEEPTLQGLYKKSVIIERKGLRIGIIGAITSTTNKISQSEKLKFLNESESINKEAERLVQEEFVDTIIVLSHSGYQLEKKIAEAAAPKIGLIVGGHSHSLLYTGNPPDEMVAVGPYPTVVEHQDGRKILVVQASAYTKFLGHISISYNNEGDVISWSGEPKYLDHTVLQDPNINIEIAEWKKEVDKYGNEVLGKTAVFLDGTSCRKEECNLGNFLTDAMLYSLLDVKTENLKNYSPIAFMNPGGIRTSLPIGDITMSRLLECQPFQNSFDRAELQGKYVKEALEQSAMDWNITRLVGGLGFLQVAGVRVVYNMTKPSGTRLKSLKVLRTDCDVPKYVDIEMDRYYTIVSNSFIMSGQDGYEVIANNIVNLKHGELDIDVLTRFLKMHNPVVHKLEGRINVVQ